MLVLWSHSSHPCCIQSHFLSFKQFNLTWGLQKAPQAAKEWKDRPESRHTKALDYCNDSCMFKRLHKRPRNGKTTQKVATQRHQITWRTSTSSKAPSKGSSNTIATPTWSYTPSALTWRSKATGQGQNSGYRGAWQHCQWKYVASHNTARVNKPLCLATTNTKAARTAQE